MPTLPILPFQTTAFPIHPHSKDPPVNCRNLTTLVSSQNAVTKIFPFRCLGHVMCVFASLCRFSSSFRWNIIFVHLFGWNRIFSSCFPQYLEVCSIFPCYKSQVSNSHFLYFQKPMPVLSAVPFRLLVHLPTVLIELFFFQIQISLPLLMYL